MAQGGHPPRHPRPAARHWKSGSAFTTPPLSQAQVKTKPSDDDGTVSFIKKVLCAQPPAAPTGTRRTPDVESKPLDALLPPLTSSNEIDVQLYAIVAVVISQFVQSWYNRITPDQDFVAQIVQIIAHCTREIEQRLRCIDLEELIFDELPALVDAHLEAVRFAQNSRSTFASPDSARSIYHSIHPHQALSPLPVDPTSSLAQQDNLVAWSQLVVSRILPLVLPPEDLQNPCLHVLVSEVFSEMIVHKAICDKASQPWLLWDGVTKAIYSLQLAPVPRPSDLASAASATHRPDEDSRLSSDVGKVADAQGLQHARLETIGRTFRSTLQFVVVCWTILRLCITALVQASAIQPRPRLRPNETKSFNDPRLSGVAAELPRGGLHSGASSQPGERRPVLCFRLWDCASRAAALDQRMPWASGLLKLLQWLCLYGPGQIGTTNSALDRLLSSQIRARLLRASLLPPALRSLRLALFPNNALAAARPPPTQLEIDDIRRACAAAIVAAVPEPVRRIAFATSDPALMRADVEASLDDFADPYLNQHLIVAALDLLVVRLFPELGEKSVED